VIAIFLLPPVAIATRIAYTAGLFIVAAGEADIVLAGVRVIAFLVSILTMIEVEPRIPIATSRCDAMDAATIRIPVAMVTSRASTGLPETIAAVRASALTRAAVVVVQISVIAKLAWSAGYTIAALIWRTVVLAHVFVNGVAIVAGFVARVRW